jgi:hypothetical protein
VLELWPGWRAGGGGDQYPVGGDGGHIRDPPTGITSVGPV